MLVERDFKDYGRGVYLNSDGFDTCGNEHSIALKIYPVR